MSTDDKQTQPAAVSDATGAFSPDDLARMTTTDTVVQPEDGPAPSDATGALTPEDLARLQEQGWASVSDATGVFTPENLGPMTVACPPPDAALGQETLDSQAVGA